MKRSVILFVSLFMAATMISSCAKDAIESNVDGTVIPTTRAYGDKSPKITAYIEVNDTNPLNCMLYRMNNEPFIDITTIFAANIRANGSEPALWLNDNVTKILVPDAGSTTTGHYKYVQPIRQDGGKVLMMQRAIQDLREQGYLETQQRWRENGGKSSLLFRLIK